MNQRSASNDAKHIHHPGDGYWISPVGHVLRVRTTHIVTVCACPEAFGLTREGLIRTFESYGEPWTSEQNARVEIIRALVSRGGWTRVRHYPRRRPYWGFNLPGLSSAHIALAGVFMRSIGAIAGSGEHVSLDTEDGRKWSTVGALVALDAPFEVELTHVPDVASLAIATASLPGPVIPATEETATECSEPQSDTSGGSESYGRPTN